MKKASYLFWGVVVVTALCFFTFGVSTRLNAEEVGPKRGGEVVCIINGQIGIKCRADHVGNCIVHACNPVDGQHGQN